MSTPTPPSSRAPRRVSRRPTSKLKTRLHQSLAQEIGTRILSGRYAEGESLPGEVESSQMLQVSRNAYREAVRTLAAKGLVESRQKAGTLVTPRSRWNLLDPEVLRWLLSSGPDAAFRESLFDLRVIVEPAAAQLAAQRRTAAQVKTIESALTEMRSHPPDSPAGEQADERFHEAIFQAAGNELLERLAAIIATGIEYVAEYKREHDSHRDSWPDHAALFDRIKDGDGPAAHEAMRNLIEHARADLDTKAERG